MQRAFFVNALLQKSDDERAIRPLSHALHDRHPLVRGFALRALLLRPERALKSYGGERLFEGLVDALDSREPYLVRGARRLLVKLAGPDSPGAKGKAREWRSWYKKHGAEIFHAPPPKADEQQDPGSKDQADEASKKPIQTQSRGKKRDIARYFTAVRERGLEVVFVVDVTTSMTDELARVRSQVKELTGFFLHLLPKKVRLGLVTYDNEVVEVVRLTSKLPKFARHVGGLKVYRNPRNSTYCEGVDKGLARALERKPLGWLQKTFKTIVILGDAPPHPPDRAAAVDLARKAAKAGVTINAIIAAPPKLVPGAEPVGPLTDIATASGGMVVELEKPEELITRLLVLSFGPDFEVDLRRFVEAYREVTGAKNRS